MFVTIRRKYFFFYFLLLPFTQVKSQNYQLPKYFLWKSYEKKLVSEFKIVGKKWAKIAAQNLWVFANHPAVPSGIDIPGTYSELSNTHKRG